MSAIIEASDIACAGAAADLFATNRPGFNTAQKVALVAQLFADHRAKAVKDLSAEQAAPAYLGRRFRKVGGFSGVEECLLWDGKSMWCLFKNPLRARTDVSASYSLKSAKLLVAEGAWEETTP